MDDPWANLYFAVEALVSKDPIKERMKSAFQFLTYLFPRDFQTGETQDSFSKIIKSLTKDEPVGEMSKGDFTIEKMTDQELSQVAKSILALFNEVVKYQIEETRQAIPEKN